MARIYFVTNRKPTAVGKPQFGADIQYSLAFGQAKVDSSRTITPELVSETDFFNALTDTLDDGRDVLNYVHGYKATFAQSLEHAKDIAERYGTSNSGERDIVLFSWPSDGQLTAYQGDKLDARRSGPAIAAAMQPLLDSLASLKRSERGKVHVACQSMGNYAFQNAIHFLQMPATARFSEIILSAPVVSRRAFERDDELAPLPEMSDRVSLYFNPGDYAKFLTLLIWEFNRMSIKGPKHPKQLDANVAIINCDAALSGNALLEHRYLHLSEEVKTDVCSVLNGVPSGDLTLNRVYDSSCNHFLLQAKAK